MGVPVAGRKKHLSDDAEKLQVSLTPEEQLVLQVIRARRKRRLSDRSAQSQIVVDGLWKLLLEEERVLREHITRLTDVEVPNSESSKKVREIRNKDGA